MIAVVIPTIRGREALYERTRKAYEGPDTVIITVRDRPTIGRAWNDGAEAALNQPGVRYLHLSADDVLPHPGALEAAATWADRGCWPSPRILNPDGSLHSCGTMGGGMLLPECATGTICGSSPFPFMHITRWGSLGPALDVHYYADDHLAWAARHNRLEPVVVRDYCLTHLEGLPGRARMVQRSAEDRQRFLAAIGERCPAPAPEVER